jgi:hypothetical protein
MTLLPTGTNYKYWYNICIYNHQQPFLTVIEMAYDRIGE